MSRANLTRRWCPTLLIYPLEGATFLARSVISRPRPNWLVLPYVRNRPTTQCKIPKTNSTMQPVSASQLQDHYPVVWTQEEYTHFTTKSFQQVTSTLSKCRASSADLQVCAGKLRAVRHHGLVRYCSCGTCRSFVVTHMATLSLHDQRYSWPVPSVVHSTLAHDDNSGGRSEPWAYQVAWEAW